MSKTFLHNRFIYLTSNNSGDSIAKKYITNKIVCYTRSRDMATSCPKPGSCGTKAPVWLRIPNLEEKKNTEFGVKR